MKKRLIIDANLLLLLVIGGVDEGVHIKNSKRLGKYDISDYNRVLKCLTAYDQICITPYIATEVSNLIDLYGHAKLVAYQIAESLFSIFQQIEVSISKDCKTHYFSEFGITDSSLIALAPDYYILTHDGRMFDQLYAASPDTIIPYESLRQF